MFDSSGFGFEYWDPRFGVRIGNPGYSTLPYYPPGGGVFVPQQNNQLLLIGIIVIAAVVLMK